MYTLSCKASYILLEVELDGRNVTSNTIGMKANADILKFI